MVKKPAARDRGGLFPAFLRAQILCTGPVKINPRRVSIVAERYRTAP
jgi:hypothetical protein